MSNRYELRGPEYILLHSQIELIMPPSQPQKSTRTARSSDDEITPLISYFIETPAAMNIGHFIFYATLDHAARTSVKASLSCNQISSTYWL